MVVVTVGFSDERIFVADLPASMDPELRDEAFVSFSLY
jgi:hypothetical protein